MYYSCRKCYHAVFWSTFSDLSREINDAAVPVQSEDKNGTLQTGMTEARSRMRSRTSFPARIHPGTDREQEKSLLSGIDLNALFTKVTSQDLIIFSRQLATLVSAGVPFLSVSARSSDKQKIPN